MNQAHIIMICKHKTLNKTSHNMTKPKLKHIWTRQLKFNSIMKVVVPNCVEGTVAFEEEILRMAMYCSSGISGEKEDSDSKEHRHLRLLRRH